MNILIINGSPKGSTSTTLQTARYLEKLHPEHTFHQLPVGQRIKSYEKDFAPAAQELSWADLLLFCYPVYTFIAPYQLHRFIELVKAQGPSLQGKLATQITTSKHFYDMTAHNYIEENCHDLGLKVIRCLSADMDDLLTKQGQQEARMFFDQTMFAIEHQMFQPAPPAQPKKERPLYLPQLEEAAKNKNYDIAIVTNVEDGDQNLNNMIADLQKTLPCPSRIINLRKFPFAGGCLGCFGCAITGNCVYKDGFDHYLRNEIQNADAIVYAFTIADHYTHSSFKNYDDRQFCNGHRTVTHGMPMAYLISGDYSQEPNLQTIVEARSQVGGNYLAGVATDEGNTSQAIQTLAQSLVASLDGHWRRPQNFYGVGGMKIFRDLIYLMQGMMKADHKFYKEHGIYDFPQKNKGKILQMKLVGLLLSSPSVQKKMKGKMTDYIIGPYQKVVDAATPEQK